MSTASESVRGVRRYPESSAMTGRLYSLDERTARKPEPAEASFLDTILGRRGSLRPILSQVEAVAGTNTTVLITGETGTGKEVIARAIHELSPRRNRNLVKVNCAAMPAGWRFAVTRNLVTIVAQAFGFQETSEEARYGERHQSSVN